MITAKPFIAHRVGMKTSPRLPLSRALASADLIHASEVFGKGIILFTGFYCTLNYMYYKELREKIEEKRSDEKDKNSKK